MAFQKNDSIRTLVLNIIMLCMSLVFIYIFFQNRSYFSGALLIVVSTYFILGIIESRRAIRIIRLTDEKGPLERVIVYVLFLILWTGGNYKLIFEDTAVSNYKAKALVFFISLYAVILIIDEMRKLQRGNQQ